MTTHETDEQDGGPRCPYCHMVDKLDEVPVDGEPDIDEHICPHCEKSYEVEIWVRVDWFTRPIEEDA